MNKKTNKFTYDIYDLFIPIHQYPFFSTNAPCKFTRGNHNLQSEYFLIKWLLWHLSPFNL